MLSSQEEQFIKAAVAAAPRIAELITAFPAECRNGAPRKSRNAGTSKRL